MSWKIKFMAQVEHCRYNNSPNFLPYDGFCPYCKSNLDTLLSLEECRFKLITGCPNPKCSRSYCE